MLWSHDRFRYLLSRPLVAKPGSGFVYSGGITLLLGEILHRVSGLSVDAFAERCLFAPLGITDYRWETFRNGTVHTAGGLALRPRDMAKIGTLMLNGGRWHGKQIVSEAWVRASTAQQAPTHDQWYAWWVPFFARSIFKKTPLEHNEHGYQWWLGSFRVHDRVVRSFRAEGRG
ncbi:MAG TPA: serine hydrolase, partial [Gemmatimonadales bacterium]|nr:serine hydrolase [Gemmatimonadales bacterium]